MVAPGSCVAGVMRGGSIRWLDSEGRQFSKDPSWADALRILRTLGPKQWPTKVHIRRQP